MIQYHNRGIKAYIALLICVNGSVVPHALPPAMLSTGLSIVLCFIYREGDSTLVQSIQWADKAFAIQIYAIILGFLIVTRSNMAITRYTDAMSGLQVMISKWLDAFMQLQGFIYAHSEKDGDKESLQVLMDWREQLAHWFSLMTTFAVSALRGCEKEAKYSEVPVFLDCYSTETLAANLICLDIDVKNRGNSVMSLPIEVKGSQDISMVGRSDTTSWPTEHATRAEPGKEDTLEFLGQSTEEERLVLSQVHDKVLVVASWICETVTRKVLLGQLKVPPPIVSRVYQEMSNGMLAFHNAMMVVIVPFPFPFAQMLTYLLFGFAILAPFMVLQFTRSMVFSPILTCISVFGYFGTDAIAKEIENPFGDDANDLPLLAMHKDFNNSLRELLIPPPHMISEYAAGIAARGSGTRSPKASGKIDSE
eukprot:CAMPEP_0168385010 /NCGR_PEP_ID=MMETSP0228-20121227/14704_1 /TAXON_ID=133427 /ORGANISM="Protoceratium reticulatum, Strain CCCM 535 (=CCMP 1889)" /LENGTH=420 /DNA_ID=CAMNT_0008398191 /DNA_START=74 /DNA_END=1336 /DNA_ORIENTATION=+